MKLPNCECKTWATTDARGLLLGNGHHPACNYHIPNLGAADLLLKLVQGIENWAADEDGIPDHVWDAYSQAHFICRGFFPKEGDLY
jgi:hypothetical protein